MADIFRWEDSIVMHLSFSEASVIHSLLGQVRGGRFNGVERPEDRATQMYGGLRAAGVDNEAQDLLVKSAHDSTTIITYNPYPEGRYK